MPEIKVLVPEERTAEFYTWFGAWLAGERTAVPEGVAPEAETPEAAVEWSGEDYDLAKELWPKLSTTAQQLIGYFADRPGEKFTGDEVAEPLGILDGGAGVAGVLGWPGRHSRKLGRKIPLRYTGDGAKYWMTSDVAKIFREVRDSN